MRTGVAGVSCNNTLFLGKPAGTHCCAPASRWWSSYKVCQVVMTAVLEYANPMGHMHWVRQAICVRAWNRDIQKETRLGWIRNSVSAGHMTRTEYNRRMRVEPCEDQCSVFYNTCGRPTLKGLSRRPSLLSTMRPIPHHPQSSTDSFKRGGASMYRKLVEVFIFAFVFFFTCIEMEQYTHISDQYPKACDLVNSLVCVVLCILYGIYRWSAVVHP